MLSKSLKRATAIITNASIIKEKIANFYKENDCCWVIEQTNFEKKIEYLLNEILIDKIEYLKKKENLYQKYLWDLVLMK